ncbi:acetyl-CoA carboxylase biotin carboxyl carrier protein subunit [Fulvivirgaceae bacterium LMO-SS25]
MEYQATIDKKSYRVQRDDSNFTIEDKDFPWDISRISDRHFHILLNNVSYNAEVVEIKREEKLVSLKINGQILEVGLKDKFDLLLDKMGLSAVNSQQLSKMKAPMPGLILDIKVAPGDNVAKGDQLLVLEAMKMENVIKSPGEGVVKAIIVKKGDSVEKNQILIEFEN